MKVYVVSSGCRFEGGGVDRIYATSEKAEAYIAPIEAARKRNAMADRVGYFLRRKAYQKLGEDYPVIIHSSDIEERIRRTSECITALGRYDFIRAQEWEVIE